MTQQGFDVPLKSNLGSISVCKPNKPNERHILPIFHDEKRPMPFMIKIDILQSPVAWKTFTSLSHNKVLVSIPHVVRNCNSALMEGGTSSQDHLEARKAVLAVVRNQCGYIYRSCGGL